MPTHPWFPLYGADLLVDTSHLNNERFGAYVKLLIYAWYHDGYIPESMSALGLILGVHTNKARSLWGPLTQYPPKTRGGFIGGFWYKTQGGYRQKRLDKELAQVIEKSEKARESANKRWKKDHANANANAMLSTTTEEKSKDRSLRDLGQIEEFDLPPDPFKSSPEDSPPDPLLDAAPPLDTPGKPNGQSSLHGFDDFWTEYPRKRGKKRSREIWARKKLGSLVDQIVKDVRLRKEKDSRWLDGYICDPPAYLNGERWEDEMDSKVKNDPWDEFTNPLPGDENEFE